MTSDEWLAERFEQHRVHLRAVAYRMLGSLGDADDAVQDAWLRFSRADTSGVDNLRGWLTTVVSRICLNVLRERRSRPERSLEARLPDPLVTSPASTDPQQQALVADAVGLAMLVVLDSLPPAERVAFVLHDVFGVPFDQLAPIVGRTPVAARQLASRGRRRVRLASATPDPDVERQRAALDAFVAASRAGDFEALLAVLDPDVVLRADLGPGAGGLREVRGAAAVAAQARLYSPLAAGARPALVNGALGAVVLRDGRPFAVLAFTVRDGRIVELDILGDPARLARLDLSWAVAQGPSGRST
jgi:RNA polymerase sigma-70 factor (ECF subfamily)